MGIPHRLNGEEVRLNEGLERSSEGEKISQEWFSIVKIHHEEGQKANL